MNTIYTNSAKIAEKTRFPAYYLTLLYGCVIACVQIGLFHYEGQCLHKLFLSHSGCLACYANA